MDLRTDLDPPGTDPKNFKVPEGSYAAGHRIALPQGAESPYKVFINGRELEAGRDYEVGSTQIVFPRPVIKETVGRIRYLIMFLGLMGSYKKNETVDIEYRINGKVHLMSDAPVIPD